MYAKKLIQKTNNVRNEISITNGRYLLACAAKARAQRAVALSVKNSGQETFTQQEQADKNAKRKR
jgi:hypothetical protein